MATKPPCASQATALQHRAVRQYPHADNGPLPPFLLASLPPPPDKSPLALPCPARGAAPAGLPGSRCPCRGARGVPGGCAGPTGVSARWCSVPPLAAAAAPHASIKGARWRGGFIPAPMQISGDVTTNHFAAFRVFLSLFSFPPLLPSPPFIAQPSFSPRTRVHAHKATHARTRTRTHAGLSAPLVAEHRPGLLGPCPGPGRREQPQNEPGGAATAPGSRAPAPGLLRVRAGPGRGLRPGQRQGPGPGQGQRRSPPAVAEGCAWLEPGGGCAPHPCVTLSWLSNIISLITLLKCRHLDGKAETLRPFRAPGAAAGAPPIPLRNPPLPVHPDAGTGKSHCCCPCNPAAVEEGNHPTTPPGQALVLGQQTMAVSTCRRALPPSPAPEQRGGPGLAPPARPCLPVPGGKEGWHQGWGRGRAVGALGWVRAVVFQMCSAAPWARGIRTGSPEQQSVPAAASPALVGSCWRGGSRSKGCMGRVIPVSANTALGNNWIMHVKEPRDAGGSVCACGWLTGRRGNLCAFVCQQQLGSKGTLAFEVWGGTGTGVWVFSSFLLLLGVFLPEWKPWSILLPAPCPSSRVFDVRGIAGELKALSHK